MDRLRHCGRCVLLSVGVILFFTIPAYALDVTLAWDANTESDLKGYKIYYRPGSSGAGVLANYDGTQAYEGDSPIEMLLGEDENSDPNTVEFTVTNLPDGQTYFFVVTAYDDEVPSNESGPSNEVDTSETPPDPVNRPPVLDPIGAKSVDEGQELQFAVTATDPDGDALTYSAGNLPPGASFDPSTHTFSWTAGYGTAGNYDVIFTVTDDGVPQASDSETVTITVDDANPPAISNVHVSSTTDTSAVIVWTTDEASDSQVQYGTMSGNYPYYRNNTNMVTSHSMTLTGLSAYTTYYFTVASADAAGNRSNPSNELYFTTDLAPDTSPPIVSNVQVASATETAATITWTTDEPADSEVQYGAESRTWENYPLTKSDATRVTTHSVSLTGLNGGTTYYFRVGSTDALGNGPTTSTERLFDTAAPPDTSPPSILPYPTIDHSSNAIDVTYSESDMQNASIEENYALSPSLLFRTLGGSDDITQPGGNTYRLFMKSIPRNTIFTLAVDRITDKAGNGVSPNSIKINDSDDDGMADDWEISNGVDDPQTDTDSDGLEDLEEFNQGTNPNTADTDGDSLPDGWEVTYGLNPLDSNGDNGGSGDADDDGSTNYEEFANNTNPVDGTSRVMLPSPVIVETIPHNDAGIGDDCRVPVESSFCVRIEASAGINIDDSTSIVFIINDGVHQLYQRNLEDDTVRVVKLTSEDDTKVTKLWAVYDQAIESDGAFPFESYVSITVDAKDTTGVGQVHGTYNFKVESELAHLAANDPNNLPDTGAVDPSDPAMDGIHYDAGVQVNSGDLIGAKLLHKSSERMMPRFGSLYELPMLTAKKIKNPKALKTSDRGVPPEHSNAKANRMEVAPTGNSMNLQPPTVFNTPVKLFVPCPEYDDVSMLSVFLYNGQEWVLACDADGNVTADGEGWMVPGSRVNHNFADDPVNGPSRIEIQVYHFSGAQAAEVSTSADVLLEPESEQGCFINTLMGQ